MPETPGAPERRDARSPSGRDATLHAALDLGTNNCRLLVARPAREGFRVVDSFSRIVRLGEGLSRTGRLDPAAMDRAYDALAICAERLGRREVPPDRVRAVATQACRAAENGLAFVERVAKGTGLKLRIIDPSEEARLSVAGCANLFDPRAEAVVVIDVGGGSTEISWLVRGAAGLATVAWVSVPLGVVSLAERLPEPDDGSAAWYAGMVDEMAAALSAPAEAVELRPLFEQGRAHLIGTSGAITSLAGIHLRLPRYNRDRVDGLWMTRGECDAAIERLRLMGRQGRAADPCIGPDRADLVLAGAAILDAVQRGWPSERVRVADRGLREGLLLEAMRRPRRRRRRWSGRSQPTT
ncbi:Ppx/GppA phosphatase family protein [Brevundimonas balnearis]|uniref:Ppx/GppA phosphatase family protein n=1 Tax=Brevundimonas balnearis TaxID=1572858 RepID=A0ABV6R1H7_9CAUL